MTSLPDIDLNEAEIARRLAQNSPRQPDPPEARLLEQFLNTQNQAPRPAAVLIPFLRLEDTWHLLFTRRHSDLPEHSGQVAFPGGRSDPEDTSPEYTALRESQEEIGIAPTDVRLLGQLRPSRTITNYWVTPVVGVIPWPYPLRLETKEVSRAFTIPLDWLADPENHEIRQRVMPAPNPTVPVIYFRHYDGELLWGISARFTLTLLEVLELSKSAS